ncbi:hypothetical protein OG501_04405 [Streptomyces niveus]|uniref:hypothetical protein n=1 Tax=Streptomyces niveus TaxID=193462 RepID=UPI0038679E45
MAFEGFDEISQTIDRYLSAAGWEQTTRSRESNVPEFISNNGSMRTSIFQYIAERSLMLTLVDVENGGYRKFEVRYGDSIDSLLAILAVWQNHVSIENFNVMINEIAKEVPEILAEPLEGDEDTPWVRVVPRE